ncbi:TPA: Eco57I restriction-modification methylase domain-containing protein [Serratia fonticola]
MENIEIKRVSVLKELDAKKTKAERNRLGQFATPSALACEMLSYAQKLISGPIKFLDPAVGSGTFYSALLQNFDSDRIIQADGFEIDPHYGIPAQEMWGGLGFNIKISDFTKAKAINDYNLIICNPPYVRHHHLGSEEKKNLNLKTLAVTGIKLSGMAGLYCHFMLQAQSWMAPEAIACWLIPSEFMDVNYGGKVKEYLLNNVTLLKIHRFSPDDLQFSDALVSSALVWIKNSKPKNTDPVTFSFGGTLTTPNVVKEIDKESLIKESKWTRFPILDVRKNESRATLGDYFTIKRGVATGSNDFFILDDEAISKYNLPRFSLRPILPSPRYLNGLEVISDEEGQPLDVKRLFLLDCKLDEDDIEVNFPDLYSYLALGRENNVHNGFLCKNRKRWYSQEARESPPIVCTYMGRIDNNSRPFRFIRNRSKAIVTNSYLAMYPKPALLLALQQDIDLIDKVWELLNAITIEDLVGEGRVYGGGLLKLEPKELAKVPVFIS